MSPAYIGTLSDMLVLSTLALLAGRSVRLNIWLVATQSALIAVLTWLMSGQHAATYTLAAAALIIKAVAIPVFLLWVVRRTGTASVPDGPSLWTWLFVGLVVLVLQRISALFTHSTVIPHATLFSTALLLTLLGLDIMVSKKLILNQVVGLVVVENGLYVTGLAMAGGLPLALELGVLVDLLVAILVLGWLAHRIYFLYDSLDLSNLNRLRG